MMLIGCCARGSYLIKESRTISVTVIEERSKRCPQFGGDKECPRIHGKYTFN